MANHFLELMELIEIPDSVYNLERFDYVAQCSYGIGASAARGRPVNLRILTNRSVI